MPRAEYDIEKKERDAWSMYVGESLSVKEALGITGKLNPMKYLREYLEEESKLYKMLTKEKKEQVLKRLEGYIKRKTKKEKKK